MVLEETYALSNGVEIPKLGLLPLPKTANPAHMVENADVDFVIAEADMELGQG